MGKQSDSYDLERAKCYMENYLSKNVMASGLAKYCKIYLFYNSDSPELQDMEYIWNRSYGGFGPAGDPVSGK